MNKIQIKNSVKKDKPVYDMFVRNRNRRYFGTLDRALDLAIEKTQQEILKEINKILTIPDEQAMFKAFEELKKQIKNDK